MAVYKRDIVDINLETGNIHRSFLKHSIGYKDQKADHFGIRTYRDGVPVDLTGVSVQGIFLPPQGDPIAITSGNIVDGNVAEVVLPQACYNYDGQFTLSIKLVDSNNSVTGTMRIVDGMVDNTHASGTVAPTSAVPTYQEILSTYDAMVAATAAANGAIAATYSSSATYKVGDYCIHDGVLYRCTTAITTAEAWTSGHWTAAKLGTDLSDLKSAVNEIADQAETWVYAFDNKTVSDGVIIDSSKRLLTHDIYFVKGGSVISIDEGYNFRPVVYYSDGTYKQMGALKVGPASSTIGTDTYIRILVYNTNETSDIVASEITSKIHTTFRLNRYYKKDATEESVLQLRSDTESAISTLARNTEKEISDIETATTWTYAFDNKQISSGVIADNNKRLLTHDIYHVPAGSTISIDAGYNFRPILYDSEGNYTGDGTIKQGPASSTIANESYIRIYVYNTNETSPITADEITNKIHTSFKLNKYYKKAATEEELISCFNNARNAIFENWSYPRSIRLPGVLDNLYIGIVQMNNGKQGVLQYNKVTKNIAKHIFDDFSTLDSHNAMAVSVMPGRHILVVGTGHMAESYLVSYISKNKEDISEFGEKTTINLPTSENGTYKATYAQLFYLNNKYHLFTRMSLISGSNYTDYWGHSIGTITTGADGSESISWSAFVPFITASSSGLKYYAKGAYYTGTKIKFFCQSNYTQDQSDIRLCYLDVSDGSITDQAGNVIGDEDNAPVAYTGIPVIISKGSAKLHINDILDGEVNAVAYSKIINSYTNGYRGFYAIYENGAWNNIELPEQGVPVYGVGSSSPGATIIDKDTLVLAKHGDSWTIEEYTRNNEEFVFEKKLLDSYGSTKIFQPYVSANVHDCVVCARGYPTSYTNMEISTSVIELV